jgi:hypothetical protein
MQNAFGARHNPVDRRVYADGGAVWDATTCHDLPVKRDFNEVACGHFRPVKAERIEVESAWATGDVEGEVIIDSLVKIVHNGQMVGRSHINSGLLALGFEHVMGRFRNHLHWVSSFLNLSRKDDIAFSAS